MSDDFLPVDAPSQQRSVEPQHALFIGTPKHPYPIKLDRYTKDGDRGLRVPPSEGRRHNPSRHNVTMDVVEVYQPPTANTPYGVPGAPSTVPPVHPATVVFSLGPDAFRTPEHKALHGDYHQVYAQRVNEMLKANFVVVHAYIVHVDRGNAAYNGHQITWGSMGTDPTMRNAGFATLEEARAYVRELLG